MIVSFCVSSVNYPDLNPGLASSVCGAASAYIQMTGALQMTSVLRVGSHVVFAWIHCTDVRIHCTDILIESR